MYFILFGWPLKIDIFSKARLNHVGVQQIDRYHFDRQSLGTRFYVVNSLLFGWEYDICIYNYIYILVVLDRAVI